VGLHRPVRADDGGLGGLNTWVLARHDKAFDPYPYILLNLFLSMLAAIQAPIILMSQNRQSEKDRVNAEHDYEVNLKAELEIMLLHDKLDLLREGQWRELLALQREQLGAAGRTLAGSESRELSRMAEGEARARRGRGALRMRWCRRRARRGGRLAAASGAARVGDRRAVSTGRFAQTRRAGFAALLQAACLHACALALLHHPLAKSPGMRNGDAIPVHAVSPDLPRNWATPYSVTT
jgi:hypothetical protein